MRHHKLSVREIHEEDIDPITDYWFSATPDFLRGMGADPDKLPTREEWINMLHEQLHQSYEEKKSYCMIWQLDGKSVGHSNVNKIVFGQEAYMHLHSWDKNLRKKGGGSQWVHLCIPYFFKNLKLKKIYCEPYALNPAPNKTLSKIGFRFVKQYTTIPGFINFEQVVNQWELPYENYKLKSKPDEY